MIGLKVGAVGNEVYLSNADPSLYDASPVCECELQMMLSNDCENDRNETALN